MTRPERCSGCGAEWGPGVLACPSCRQLVHAGALEQLASEAAALRVRGDLPGELERWRSAVALLPPESKQAARIGVRIAALEPQVPATEPQKKPTAIPKWLAGIGALGIFIWKAQALLVFVASKANVILAGFASWQTMLSMLLAFGVYWAAWGWSFAAGLIVSMYIHELGHVVALKLYGIPASAPMFIPGIGAFVRLDRHPPTPEQDARVGLAGPWFGLATALAAAGLWVATGNAMFGAIAQVGAWINLFNLIPIWQLDGGRGFASLTRAQRGLAALAIATAWLVSGESLLLLILIAAAGRTLLGSAPPEGDWRGLGYYVVILAALTALVMLEVPSGG